MAEWGCTGVAAGQRCGTRPLAGGAWTIMAAVGGEEWRVAAGGGYPAGQCTAGGHRSALRATGEGGGRGATRARHREGQRARPAGSCVTGRGAAVVAAAQAPSARLLAGGAVAAAAAPLARVAPAGTQRPAAPLAEQLLVARHRALHGAAPAALLRDDAAGLGAVAVVAALLTRVTPAGQRLAARCAAGGRPRVARQSRMRLTPARARAVQRKRALATPAVAALPVGRVALALTRVTSTRQRPPTNLPAVPLRLSARARPDLCPTAAGGGGGRRARGAGAGVAQLPAGVSACQAPSTRHPAGLNAAPAAAPGAALAAWAGDVNDEGAGRAGPRVAQKQATVATAARKRPAADAPAAVRRQPGVPSRVILHPAKTRVGGRHLRSGVGVAALGAAPVGGGSCRVGGIRKAPRVQAAAGAQRCCLKLVTGPLLHAN